MTFETYDYRFNAAAIAGYGPDLATCKFIRDGRSLVFADLLGLGNYVKHSLM